MAQLKRVQGAWRALLDLLFPPCCVGCGRVDTLLCEECRRSIAWVEPPYCLHCGRPLAAASFGQPTCTICALYPLGLDGVRAAVEFSGVVRKAIHAFKYRGHRSLAVPLSALLAQAWDRAPFPVEVIVPVPLHPRRLADRGYNQSILIAEELARQVQLPLLDRGLLRSRLTLAQTRLSAAERRNNVDGAFAIAFAGELEGRAVLLVDDVCTTGSTLRACGEALRAGGASRVFAMTLARAAWDPVTGTMADADG